MIRAAIIGFAHMHVNEIAIYIMNQPDTELCCVADIELDIPENTEKRYTREWNLKNVLNLTGAKYYKDYVKMLDVEKPDVTYILCENNRKADIIRQVAERHTDIIVEKPMATTQSDAQKIIEYRNHYNVNIFVNWPVAWRKYVRQMVRAVDLGLCGELKKLRYINGHTGPLGKGARHRGVTESAEELTDEEKARIWWYRKECGGGAYADILCYGCCFTRWMFGKMPNEILSVGMNLNTPGSNVEDNVAALLTYPDAMAVIEGTWTTPRCRMPSGPEAICTDGVVWCDGAADGEAFVSAIDSYGNKLEVPTEKDDYDLLNMPNLYAAYIKGRKNISEILTLEFNADVAAMIEMAEESNRCHTAVRISK